MDYPARYLFQFLDHHGMPSIGGAPQWRTVVGGSATYVEALAARLIRLIDDPALRARMGAAGRAAAPPFGAARMVEATDAWYRRLGGIG